MPYQPLEASSDTSSRAGSSEKQIAGVNGSSSSSDSRIYGSAGISQTLGSPLEENPAALLVDGMELSRPFDLSSESAAGDGSKGTSTGTRGGRKRTVSFWVSLSLRSRDRPMYVRRIYHIMLIRIV